MNVVLGAEEGPAAQRPGSKWSRVGQEGTGLVKSEASAGVLVLTDGTPGTLRALRGLLKSWYASRLWMIRCVASGGMRGTRLRSCAAQSFSAPR